MRAPLVLALAVLLGSDGCHRSKPGDVVEVPGSVTVKIVNSNVLDVVIYVVHDAYRERLGDVTAKTTRSFELPFRRLGAGHEFVLLADPVGSLDPIRTETVHPLDGQVMTWTLESDFARSHWEIF